MLISEVTITMKQKEYCLLKTIHNIVASLVQHKLHYTGEPLQADIPHVILSSRSPRLPCKTHSQKYFVAISFLHSQKFNKNQDNHILL